LQWIRAKATDQGWENTFLYAAVHLFIGLQPFDNQYCVCNSFGLTVTKVQLHESSIHQHGFKVSTIKNGLEFSKDIFFISFMQSIWI